MRTDKYSLRVNFVDEGENLFYTLYLNSDTRPLVPSILKTIQEKGKQGTPVDVIKEFINQGVKIVYTVDCLDYSVDIEEDA